MLHWEAEGVLVTIQGAEVDATAASGYTARRNVRRDSGATVPKILAGGAINGVEHGFAAAGIAGGGGEDNAIDDGRRKR